ncbi:hypothetical protein C8R47DRAFT_1224369 [Mycena vitilis]|nr:hypothetical protein C8R47DRAFT_1224369 [Mycena vitilis]
MDTTIRDVPPLMVLDLTHDKLVFNELLSFQVQGVAVNMRLRGIVYGGQNHFTCRLIGKDGRMWFHDGITTGRDCVPEVNFRSLQDKLVLHKCGEKKAFQELQSRAPLTFDPRPSQVTTRKDQSNTSTCVSFAITTIVEGTVQRTFSRTTTKDLSPIWVAVCRAQRSDLDVGGHMATTLDAVGNSWFATEDCMPWSARSTDPQCQKNQCGLSQYGKLPYISDRVSIDAAVVSGKLAWQRMMEHISTVGPVSLNINTDNSFQTYAATLASEGADKIFYDGHPDYPASTCGYGGHAVTIIGYGQFVKPGSSKSKMYWIVQNSWGVRSGRNGYVFIAAGSLGSGNTDYYGVKVREGFPFFNKLSLPGDLLG